MQLLKFGFAVVCIILLLTECETRAEATCPEDSLPCDDGTECFKRNIEWCDGYEDCQDKSDEAYCLKKGYFVGKDRNHCEGTHFLCDDGRCVPLIAKCDGHKDCSDGSDEKKCEPEPTAEPELTFDYDDYDTTTAGTERLISQGQFPDVSEEDVSTYYPFTTSTTDTVYVPGAHETQDGRTTTTASRPWSSNTISSIRPHHSSRSYDRAQGPFTQTYDSRGHVDRSWRTTTQPTRSYDSRLPDQWRTSSTYPTRTYVAFTEQHPRRDSFLTTQAPRTYDPRRGSYQYTTQQTRTYDSTVLGRWKTPFTYPTRSYVGLTKKRNPHEEITTQSFTPTATISTRDGEIIADGLTKRKLLDWFLGRRKNVTVTNKWGHELPRIAVALFLAEKEFFEPGDRTMEEMNYELTIRLLLQMTGGGNLKRKDLSLYIHALMVTCVDPRNFHGRDLVSELRSIIDSGNETVSSFDLLVLCNAGDTMTDKDAEKITAAFDSQHRPFWTDNQAMATLALACISSRPGVKVDERTVMYMVQELKKRQFRNGTVDNLKTTALVVQALIATQSVQRDFDLDAALRVIQNAQREDGSIGSFLDSYYILPVLANSSLLDVNSEHCKRSTTSEAEALSELQGARGQRLVIQFSVWIGSEVDLKRTWTLKVPVNSSLYNILETVYRLDTRQQVLYNVLDGKPYVSSMMGLQDDVETGLYWFTYVRNTKDDDPTLVEESPVDVKIHPNQELILWYKSGQWNKHSSELTT